MRETRASLSALTIKKDMGPGGDIPHHGRITDTARTFTGEAPWLYHGTRTVFMRRHR
jgi:hypothetical protein